MNLRESFLRYNAQTSPSPLLLEIVSAKGVFLFGANGEKYIDLISGISVSNLGHSVPEIQEAVKKQIDSFSHLMVYGEFVQAPQVELACLLKKILPNHLDNIYFVNSGSEATEGAMKLAKRFTGRKKMLAFKNAYHGSTQGALSLMGSDIYKEGYLPLLPEIDFLEFNKEEDLIKIDSSIAAVFVEPIQGEAGVILPNNNFLQKLQKQCNSVGALLVVDEIQTGFGRTGKMFAFEKFDFVPDILLLAKAMGAGFPIGAFISSKEIMNSLSENPILGHISTFGGHPVSCAAAIAGINYLNANKILNRVEEKGNLFKKLLKHEKIIAVEGCGLLLAIRFESFDFNKKLIDQCIRNGVLTDWFLHNSESMRIAPPLTISEEEIRKSCQIILDCLNDLST